MYLFERVDMNRHMIANCHDLERLPASYARNEKRYHSLMMDFSSRHRRQSVATLSQISGDHCALWMDVLISSWVVIRQFPNPLMHVDFNVRIPPLCVATKKYRFFAILKTMLPIDSLR
jgi:hypothetical protein